MVHLLLNSDIYLIRIDLRTFETTIGLALGLAKGSVDMIGRGQCVCLVRPSGLSNPGFAESAPGIFGHERDLLWLFLYRNQSQGAL